VGRPAPKRPKRLTARIKGKPVRVDLSKSGIGTGEVLIDILTDRGHSVVEIVRVEKPKEESEEADGD